MTDDTCPECNGLHRMCSKLERENAALRAQVAERDALLREIVDEHPGVHDMECDVGGWGPCGMPCSCRLKPWTKGEADAMDERRGRC